MRELSLNEIDNVSGGDVAMGLASGWAGTVAGVGASLIIGGVRGTLVGGVAGFAVGAAVGVGYHLATSGGSSNGG